MSLRTRKYVLTAILVLISAVYGHFAGGWNDLRYYGGAAALLVLTLSVGLPWLEFAPDGAFRRRPQT
jgi:hypothetical protein